MDYIRNKWYVASWSREVEKHLIRITIMSENIVLFRTSDDSIVAFEDRCPHKSLPLSKGKIVHNGLQCGYHGMTFGYDGRCIRIPGQEQIPETACVKTYPIYEQYNIIWIWMGKPEKANIKDIFKLQQFDDPTWTAHQGDTLYLKSNYLNVAENLVDPAHVSFVHPTTLGNPEGEDVKVQVDTSGSEIKAWRWIRDAPPVGFFQTFGNFSGNVDRWHYYYLYMPSIAVIDFGSAPSELRIGENERHKGVRVFAIHLLTPVSKTECIDRWMHLRNIQIDDKKIGSSMDKMFRVAFAEDKEILESIQEEELYSRERKPVHLAIDKAPNVYRLRIKKLAKEERKLAND
jgi:phenylpropionate dioxygenase-like ring-hydroxylating dioxygenase large terminal subunit